jgi:hypothetical protein
VHLEAREQVADVQRNSQAGSETVELQLPFGDVAGIRGCSVVIVLEWGDLQGLRMKYRAKFAVGST